MADTLGTGKPTTMTETRYDHPGVIAPPPLIWLGHIAVGVGLIFAFPIALIPSGLQYPLGGALIALGLGVMLTSTWLFRRAGTNIPTYRPATTVVTSGPYRLSRNPIYLSMIVGHLGIGVVTDNVWMIALVVPLALLLRYGVIAREERYLEGKFGEDYRRYKTTVRRWL